MNVEVHSKKLASTKKQTASEFEIKKKYIENKVMCTRPEIPHT